MISRADLALIGKVNKTHGIDGELSVSVFDSAVAEGLVVGDCMLFDIDGIFVPFFIANVRQRGSESLLITFDGESSREAVTPFVGRDVFLRRERVEVLSGDEEDEGLYAGSLISFKAMDVHGNFIGVIEDIDDSSDNPLFIVSRSEIDRPLLIPIVEDFIREISDDTIVFVLPDGLLDL